LSKPSAVSLPLVLLLIDYYLKKPFEFKVKVPFFVLSLLFGVIALYAINMLMVTIDLVLYFKYLPRQTKSAATSVSE